MSLALETVKLTHAAPVELYVLDATPLGGGVHRFAPQVNELGQSIVWQGQTYNPLPIQTSGFESRATGAFPRPKLSCSNVLGIVGPLLRQYDNLRGAFVTRKRTLARYLDAVNFAAGNPDADPLADYPDEIWRMDQVTARNKLTVAWELRNPLDFEGVVLPARVVRSNHCPIAYRSSDCGYAGGAVAKADDSPTADPAQDRCSQKLSGCKLRFPDQPLPGHFFPGVGRFRQI